MVSVKNLIVKDGNHSASRHGFLRLSRVLPTSCVFTSGYVNTETILHFFNQILQTEIRSNVWQTVWRITIEIVGVKGSK